MSITRAKGRNRRADRPVPGGSNHSFVRSGALDIEPNNICGPKVTDGLERFVIIAVGEVAGTIAEQLAESGERGDHGPLDAQGDT